MRRKIVLLLTISIMWLMGAGQALQSQSASELRAVWVTRWNYHTPEDVVKIMQNVAGAHFNVVLFQARGNATAFYASTLEPWAEELGGQDPGWDPLRLAIQTAHANGLQLHVWFNVGPGWRGTTPPEQPTQLWHAHPEWFARTVRGNPQQLNSHYVWLAMTNPAARAHVAAVAAELLRKYRPDGLHFDYIRYPGPGVSYDVHSLREFAAMTGKTPETDPREWDHFRRESLTAFLQMVRDSVAAIYPQAILSAAVWRDYALGRNVFFQDSHAWIKSGLLDWLFPMIYTENAELFRHELREHLASAPRARIFPGINSRSDMATLEQIDITRFLRTGGYAIYSYSTLFPDHEESDLARSLRKAYQKNRAEVRAPRVRPVAFKVDEIFTWPATVTPGEPFFLFCRYNPRLSAKMAGAFVEWKNPLPDTPLHTLPYGRGLLVTQTPVLLQDHEQWLELRVVAVTSGATPDTAFSSWYHLPVPEATLPVDTVQEIGPPIGGAQYIAADAFGNLWVPSWWENAIYVESPEGKPLPFSPVTAGLDDSGRPLQINRPAGITVLHGDTILIAGHADRGIIMRFSATTGLPLPGIATPFVPGDLAASPAGEVFVTAAGKGDWYHFYPDDEIGKTIPVKGGHFLRGIAVSPDGLSAYTSCQVEGIVHHWQRLNALGTFEQVPDLDVEAVSVGCVDTDNFGKIYVSHTGSGFVTVFSPDGRLAYVLEPEQASIRGPRGVAVTPHGVFIVQMGGTTAMPLIRLQSPALRGSMPVPPARE